MGDLPESKVEEMGSFPVSWAKGDYRSSKLGFRKGTDQENAKEPIWGTDHVN